MVQGGDTKIARDHPQRVSHHAISAHGAPKTSCSANAAAENPLQTQQTVYSKSFTSSSRNSGSVLPSPKTKSKNCNSSSKIALRPPMRLGRLVVFCNAK